MENKIKEFNELNGFIKHNNIKISSVSNGVCEGSVTLEEHLYNPYGIAHGGLIFGFADTLMGLLAGLRTGKALTINSSINYLKPCKGSIITGKAKIVKEGKNIGYYEASIYNELGELAATATTTYMFFK